MRTLSATALAAIFAPESDDNLITLLTFDHDDLADPIRLCDHSLGRISETDEEVVYGVTSRTEDYIYLPMEVTLPTDDQMSAPRMQIVIRDVTRYLIPVIRSIPTSIPVTIELVLASDPDTVEATFSGFELAGITYNRDQVTGDLSIPTLTAEPFPAGTFTPASFPGIY